MILCGKVLKKGKYIFLDLNKGFKKFDFIMHYYKTYCIIKI